MARGNFEVGIDWSDSLWTKVRVKSNCGGECRLKAVSEKVSVTDSKGNAVEFELKDAVYALVMREKRIPVVLGQLEAMGIDRELYQALTELLTGM